MTNPPPPGHSPNGGWPPPPPGTGYPYPQPPGSHAASQPAPRRRRTGLVVALVVVGVVVLACGSLIAIAVAGGGNRDRAVARFETPPAGDPTTETNRAGGDTFGVPVGTPLTVTADDGGVQQVTVVRVKRYPGGCDDTAPAPDNGAYVVVDVQVVQQQGSGQVNPLFFTYVAEDGTSANAFSGLFSGCDTPRLGTVTGLREGGKRSGRIAFDAPSGAGAVEFAPGGPGGDTVGSWTVS